MALGKVTKWGTVKLTGIALTATLAINYTVENVTNDITQHITQAQDNILVVNAEQDSSLAAFVDSLHALVSEMALRLDREPIVRDTTIFRDSLVVTLRDSIVVNFQTTIRESTRWVIDTTRVEVAFHRHSY